MVEGQAEILVDEVGDPQRRQRQGLAVGAHGILPAPGLGVGGPEVELGIGRLGIDRTAFWNSGSAMSGRPSLRSTRPSVSWYSETPG